MRNGTRVKNQAFCNQWDTDDFPQYFFCYLLGGSAASVCPGAVEFGDIYYTSDPSVCIAAGNAGPEVGKYRNKYLVCVSLSIQNATCVIHLEICIATLDKSGTFRIL